MTATTFLLPPAPPPRLVRPHGTTGWHSDWPYDVRPHEATVSLHRLTDPDWVADRITMAAAASESAIDLPTAGTQVFAGSIVAVLLPPLARAATGSPSRALASARYDFDDHGFPCAFALDGGNLEPDHPGQEDLAEQLHAIALTARRFVFRPTRHFTLVSQACLSWVVARVATGPDTDGTLDRIHAFVEQLADGAAAWPVPDAQSTRTTRGCRPDLYRRTTQWLDSRARGDVVRPHWDNPRHSNITPRTRSTP